ncbi:Scr1 family TA system antitoxin-like transcriptional regulator [Kribbella sancticallisti]|uniref:Scr1 family TA system antitoxin-like transcriptional regulator n=1 Tax=Kribbella sancticallisti TaxID=460087 RepID=UPI003CD09A21
MSRTSPADLLQTPHYARTVLLSASGQAPLPTAEVERCSRCHAARQELLTRGKRSMRLWAP